MSRFIKYLTGNEAEAFIAKKKAENSAKEAVMRFKNLEAKKPSRGSNEWVAKRWIEGKSGKSGNMLTDGEYIYSYWLPIGRTIEGKKTAYDYTAGGGRFYSMTTSKHCSYVKRAAERVIDIKNNKKEFLDNSNNYFKWLY
jgi:hypothetical protein